MRIGIPFLVFMTLAVGGACRSEVMSGLPFPTDPRYANPAGPLRSAGDDLRAADLSGKWIERSDFVFVGRVVHVAESPGFWCGIVATSQAVLYRVETVLKGREPGDEVVVHHLLVGPPQTEANEPRLSEAIWREGARLLVAATLEPVPGADLVPGGHGMLRFTESMDVVAADGAAGLSLMQLVR